MADTQAEAVGESREEALADLPIIYVHHDEEPDLIRTFFEIPADIVERVYARNPYATFTTTLRNLLDRVDRS
jgi:hypothetical protein